MSHIRSNAHPVILSSTREVAGYQPEGHVWLSQNIILTVARELFDGDLFGWSMDLLFATQMLRMVYDSPRIGGGIDPALATNLPDWDTAREESSILGYLVGRPDSDLIVEDLLEGLDGDFVQDCIVHAEAVAARLIHLCDVTGRAY